MLNLSHRQTAKLSAWVGCLIPVLIVFTIIGGILYYLAYSERRAADYDHSPNCYAGSISTAGLPPCTYSDASVARIGYHHDKGSYWGTDLSLLTPEGKSLQVTVAGTKAHDAVHLGDTAMVQHWSGVTTYVKIRSAWYKAVTNPENYTPFNFDADILGPVVGSVIVYLFFGSFLRKSSTSG